MRWAGLHRAGSKRSATAASGNARCAARSAAFSSAWLLRALRARSYPRAARTAHSRPIRSTSDDAHRSARATRRNSDLRSARRDLALAAIERRRGVGCIIRTARHVDRHAERFAAGSQLAPQRTVAGAAGERDGRDASVRAARSVWRRPRRPLARGDVGGVLFRIARMCIEMVPDRGLEPGKRKAKSSSPMRAAEMRTPGSPRVRRVRVSGPPGSQVPGRATIERFAGIVEGAAGTR